MKNERNEWDLPGGKLKPKEQIQDCLTREIKEELSISVRPHRLVQALTMKVMNTIEIFIVIYTCLTHATIDELEISEESFELGTFSLDEIDGISLQQTYKDAIKQAYRELV